MQFKFAHSQLEVIVVALAVTDLHRLISDVPSFGINYLEKNLQNNRLVRSVLPSGVGAPGKSWIRH